HQLRGRRLEGGQIARDKRVDGEHAGDARRFGHDQREPSQRWWDEMELVKEDEDDEQGEPEIRQGAGKEPIKLGDAIDHAALVEGADDTEQQTDDDGQQESIRNELKG